MKVLVTGGAGYIGSVCGEELIRAGHEVVVWDNLSEGHRAAVHPQAIFLQGDLADRDLLQRAVQEHRPEAVIHFAGKALVPESMRDPSLYYRVNVGGGIHLLDAMVSAGCRKIIFSSTCATYGLPEKMPLDEHFGHVVWQVADRARQPGLFRHVGEQRVDARRANVTQHRVAVRVGQRKVTHYKSSTNAL